MKKVVAATTDWLKEVYNTETIKIIAIFVGITVSLAPLIIAVLFSTALLNMAIRDYTDMF